MHLKPGKLPLEVLERLLLHRGVKDRRVIIGPSIGIDAAGIDFGRRLLVAASDPVTLATSETGWYAVNINANDVAVMGARPRWFLASLLLPESELKLTEEIFRQIHEACRELQVALVGGHTEIAIGLKNPILVGTMLGEVPKRRVITAGGAKVGHRLIITKGIAVEGTAILAREREAELRKRFGKKFVEKAKGYLHSPGISVVKEALIAAGLGASALHDVTEGGLIAGAFEMMKASGLGLELLEESVPILPEAKVISEHFGIDVFRLISSGTLLVAADAERSKRILKRLEREKILAREIGRFCRSGFWMVRRGKRHRIKVKVSEEIVKVLEEKK